MFSTTTMIIHLKVKKSNTGEKNKSDFILSFEMIATRKKIIIKKRGEVNNYK